LISDFAKEENGAIDPGSTSPARLWACSVMMKIGEYVAPNGDHFAAKSLPIGRGPFWGSRGFQCSINGIACDVQSFKKRLALHYPRKLYSLEKMLSEAQRYGQCWQRTVINGHHHTLKVMHVNGKFSYCADNVEVERRDFEHYLRSSFLPDEVENGGSGRPED
jgi:hypothetical protein